MLFCVFKKRLSRSLRQQVMRSANQEHHLHSISAIAAIYSRAHLNNVHAAKLTLWKRRQPRHFLIDSNKKQRITYKRCGGFFKLHTICSLSKTNHSNEYYSA